MTHQGLEVGAFSLGLQYHHHQNQYQYVVALEQGSAEPDSVHEQHPQVEHQEVEPDVNLIEMELQGEEAVMELVNQYEVQMDPRLEADVRKV